MTNQGGDALQAQTERSGMTVRIPQHVVHRAFVSETVVLNLETGKYHGLNPTGGRMLEVLERVGDCDDAVGQLATEFNVPAEQLRQDLAEFCEDLAQRGLLDIVSRGDR
jgi:hypothetical protein